MESQSSFYSADGERKVHISEGEVLNPQTDWE